MPLQVSDDFLLLVKHLVVALNIIAMIMFTLVFILTLLVVAVGV